jgi:hypothetical protein
MTCSRSRRNFVQGLGLTAGLAVILPKDRVFAAGAVPHLDPKDPMAAGLSYAEDAGKVDATKNPTFAAGRTCANCLQLTGAPGAPYRPCKLFPGKLVNVNGWCKAWAAQI